MELTIVRHTQVDVPKGICYGRADVSLANSHIIEIKNISDRIENQYFDAIFTSPLSRCRILAETLFPDRVLSIDHRLSELDFGDWEMKPWSAIYESDAGKRWFADYLNTKCPNGGSYVDMVEHVKAFIDDLNQQAYSNVLIVTHAGVLRILMAIFENKTPEETFETPLQYGEIKHYTLNK